MATLWLVLVSFMVTMYVIFDGFDLGAGMVYWLFAKDEHQRQLVKNSIGPFWDGNEVWLIAGGGVLFLSFPRVYSSSFSGFYLPFIILLWLLILRGISIELRNHVENVIWKSLMDFWFGMSAFLIALFLGAALGNIVRGVNLGGVVNGTAQYSSTYFFATLWTDFGPYGNVGVLDWFTVTMGVTAVVVIFFHGAAWIIKKTDSPLNNRLRSFGAKWSWAIPVLVLITGCMMYFVRAGFYKNYFEYIYLYIFPALGLFASVLIPRAFKNGEDGHPFLYTTVFIFTMLISTLIGMYPDLLPSTNNMNPALTIHNSATSHYGMVVGLVWWCIAMVLVIIYFTFIHRIFAGKMSEETVEY
ncbi:MAG TPA: cytochrome d ubiquinol oxidase subunit II [Balneolaceae bacterium]|nr:cytochrome d ubiquinol oxidase subunit II [Balneolaceae bacterium]